MEAVSLSFVFSLSSSLSPLTVTWFSTVVEQDAIIRTGEGRSASVFFSLATHYYARRRRRRLNSPFFAILSDKAKQCERETVSGDFTFIVSDRSFLLFFFFSFLFLIRFSRTFRTSDSIVVDRLLPACPSLARAAEPPSDPFHSVGKSVFEEMANQVNPANQPPNLISLVKTHEFSLSLSFLRCHEMHARFGPSAFMKRLDE